MPSRSSEPWTPAAIRDKDSLIQVLYGAIRFEEYGSYFYEKIQYKVPNREARIFMEVLADEGRTHAEILKQQIDALRLLDVAVDDRGRAVESLLSPSKSMSRDAERRPVEPRSALQRYPLPPPMLPDALLDRAVFAG